MKKKCHTTSALETKLLAERIGRRLQGGEVFVFKSDLGGGKTTFVRGLVEGFGSPDPVASPTFTISFVYARDDGRRFHHFDFYRLDEPGIIAHEIHEALEDGHDVVAVEWGDSITSIIPADAVTIELQAVSDTERSIAIDAPKAKNYLFEGIIE